ncbi:cytochrome b5 domain-containing protein [Candidatus Saccharibacteria bacterium]|nr:cytochrome b5 domain-containing protein [Candidatus Saccharibacteria bacterium]
MNNKIIFGILALIIVGGGLFLILGNNSSNNKQQTLADENTVYSTGDVAQHNQKSDCWTIIDGEVYDLTSYVPRHQGGDDILAACGVDATSYFNGEQAGDSGRTQNHSLNGTALGDLAKLKIGSLAN